MFLAAENLDFEKAARLRDELRKLQGGTGERTAQVSSNEKPARKAAPASKRPRRSSRAR